MAARLALVGKMTLSVISARDLKDVNIFDKMDPYCEIKMGVSGEKFKTQVAMNQGSTPVWNQSFLFNLTGQEDIVHLEVKTKQTLSDDTIGRADIALSALNYKNEQFWVELKDINNFSKTVGRLCLQCKFEGEGLPASYLGATTPQSATTPQPQSAVTPQPQPNYEQYQQPYQQPIYAQTPQPVYVQQPQVVYAAPQPQVIMAQPVYAAAPSAPVVMATPIAQPVAYAQPVQGYGQPPYGNTYGQQHGQGGQGWNNYPGNS